MSIATAADLIHMSFADLGVIRVGETLSTGIQNDALIRLNTFVNSAAIQQVMSFLQKHTTYSLQSGVSRYTFGVGGTFNTAARPQKATAWRALSGTFGSGGLVLTMEELQAQSKAAFGETTSIPSLVGADTASPLITVGVNPIPNSAPGTLELSYYSAITAFALLTTTLASVGFPDGWEEFLHFNFAIALLPRYGRQGFKPDALIVNAQNAKEALANLNRPAGQQASPVAA